MSKPPLSGLPIAFALSFPVTAWAGTIVPAASRGVLPVNCSVERLDGARCVEAGTDASSSRAGDVTWVVAGFADARARASTTSYSTTPAARTDSFDIIPKGNVRTLLVLGALTMMLRRKR